MSRQSCDILHFRGKPYPLASSPLAPFLESRGIKFYAPDTNNRRGYKAEWTIRETTLYLTRLKAWAGEWNSPKEVGLDYLFPFQEEAIAYWVSEVLVSFIGSAFNFACYPLHYRRYDLRLEIQGGKFVCGKVVRKEWPQEVIDEAFENFAYNLVHGADAVKS